MADNNQLKRIDPVEFGDDDPFAELTRIMGFDPRVPVRPAASAAQASPHAAAPAVAAPVAVVPEPELDLPAEDFTIDLEKELLGDFALDEEPQEVAAPVAPATAPAFESEVAAADIDPDLDVAIAADLDEELLLDQTAATAEAAGEQGGEVLVGADFDAAFEQELTGDLEPVRDEPVYGGPGHDELPRDADDQPEHALSVEDAALLAALAPADPNEHASQERDFDPVPAEAPRDLAADEIDLDFDVAMADVDMDFSADPHADVHEANTDEMTSSLAEPNSADPYEAGAIDFDDFEEPAFEDAPAAAEIPDGTAYAAMADIPVAEDFEPVAEAPEPVAEAYEVDGFDAETQDAHSAVEASGEAGSVAGDPEELSLEDELNALLGNSVPRAELTGGYDAPPLTASLAGEDEQAADALADFEADLAAWDPLAPGADDNSAPEAYAPTPEAYAPAPQAYGDEAEAYAADDYAGPSYQVAEVEYAEDAQEPASFEAEDGQAAEDELQFDDGAFHAAFESSLVSDEAETVDETFDTQHAVDEAEANPEAEGFHASHVAPSSSYVSAVPLAQASAWEPAASAVDEDIPDIDTVDVPETAVAMADDLDIPELAYEDEVRAAPAYDEFESEFAAAYAEPAQPEDAGARLSEADNHATAKDDYDERYAETQNRDDDPGYAYAGGIAAAAGVAGSAYASAGSQAAGRRDFDAGDAFDAADLPGSRKPAAGDADPFDAADYDDLDEEIALPAYIEQRPQPQRRGLLVAAIVGGVAVLGGVGAFALSFGGGSDAPAIVRADDSPIKVRPENPGGTTVPNQENKVYETVAGRGGADAPAQEKLISSAEEPVDMAARVPEAAPAAPEGAQATDSSAAPEAAAQATGTDPLEAPEAGVADAPVVDEIAAITAKAEDRVAPSAAATQPETDNTEVAAVAPRRVRTMVVRPDGTLVPREDPAPVAAAEPQGAAEAMMESGPVTASAEPEVTNTTGPTFQAPGRDPVPVETASPANPPKNAPKAATSGMPASVPVAPSRPADQPVDVVGEVKPEQVASISPTAAAAGAWSMQIASQPSEDAAKSTYQDLARRYANVLGGRGVTIVKAEIAGKGTFWRVRVPAGSRNEAIGLCEDYKSAGGNCFVSK